MRRPNRLARGFGWLAAALIGWLTGPLGAQQAVEIQDATAEGFAPTAIEVIATTDVATEGFVLAIGYDTTLASVIDVTVEGSATEIAGAELVVGEVFDLEGGATLAVVVDAAPPFTGSTIPPLAGEVIATFVAVSDIFVDEMNPDFGLCQGTTPEGSFDGVPVEFTFEDGVFNDPPLSNVLVQGGVSIGILAETTTSSGTMCMLPPLPDSIQIEGTGIIPDGGTSCTRILLDLTSGPAQGFQLAIVHDPALQLVSIDIVGTLTEALGAEFVATNVENEDSGGTMGVLLDLLPPFDGQTFPVGNQLHIANFCYQCIDPPFIPNPPQDFPLEFMDETVGNPTIENVVVVDSLNTRPTFVNGTATCAPIVPGDTKFLCGRLDGEGEFDATVFGENLEVVDVEAMAGSVAQVCIGYIDPTDNAQGFQFALCLPDESVGILEFKEGSFSVEGTILEDLGTEFINQSQDNNPNDGDGIEMTIGILLDALPPFENQTVPSTDFPLVVGCFDVCVSDQAECNTCYPLAFCNGVDASEAVPVENAVVQDFQSEQGIILCPCSICIVVAPEFRRGDCNDDEKVDLSDAAAVLGAQFQGVVPNCLDACDANDDGKINLADSVFLFQYLFKSGAAPDAPGPIDLGPDPTLDDLDCESGPLPCM